MRFDDTMSPLPGNQYKVSLAELQERLLPIEATRADVIKIEPLVFQGDTVLFLVNYKTGWELMSSDKRTCPVIARGKEENLDEVLLEKNAALKHLLIAQCRHILELRRDSTGVINDYWKDESLISSTRNRTREAGWRLIHVGDTSVTYTYIPHIIGTKWGQLTPWNECTPYLIQGYAFRSATGCVNVAYAQILYWANAKYGIPEYMYTQASCSGYVYPYVPPIFSFTDSSSTAWSQIRVNQAAVGNADYASYLMAKVAQYTNTAYSIVFDSGNPSPVSLSDFDASQITWLRGVFNLNASFLNYNTTTVVSSLFNDKPVMIGAYDDELNHVWIIDGYEHSYHSVRLYYIWDPYNTYNPGSGIIEEEEDEPGNGLYYGAYSFDCPAGYESNIVEYPTTSVLFYMNWGNDGAGDSIGFSPYAVSWSLNGNTYATSSAVILSGFTPYNQN